MSRRSILSSVAVDPRAKVAVNGAAVNGKSTFLALRSGGDILLEGLAQGSEQFCCGYAPFAGILTGGDRARASPGRGAAPGSAVTRPWRPMTRRRLTAFRPAGADTVVDDIGANAGGLDSKAESRSICRPTRGRVSPRI